METGKNFIVKLKAQGSKLKGFGLLLVVGLMFLWVAPIQQVAGQENKTPIYGYKIMNVFPHDPKAFTQGLIFYRGFLYEGTGLYGQSTLRKVELETGKVVQQFRLPDALFGEGVTLWADQLIQLTWKNRMALVYDRESFRLVNRFSYPTEGWGITQDGRQLIMSDGTDTLTFLDPDNFKVQKRIRVHDQGRSIPFLNELEYVKGEILANVYQTDRIVRIAPASGQVTGWIDLTGLLPKADHSAGAGVLNGIAYDDQQDRLFVTGKNWPKLFEIKLVRSDKRHKPSPQE